MGYSEQTPNYHLPQYIGGDRPSYLGDWNQGMGIIDGAMHNNAVEIEANKTAVANMKTYVDNSVDDLTESVDSKLQTVDTKLANVYTKPESDSKFIHKINGGICVAVGDSITLGTGTSVPSTDAWPIKLAAKRNFELYNYAQNNAGFSAPGSGTPSRTFIQQLQAAAADTSFSNEAVKIVIIAGGINDAAYISTIESNARSCFAYAKTTFTNAEIWCIPVIAGKAPLATLQGGNRWECVPPIISAINSEGVNAIEGAWTWMIGQSQWANDDIHPNTAGAVVIADYVNSGLNHNPVYPSYKGAATPQNGTSTGNVICVSNNGVVSISGNFNVANDVAAYKPLMLLPEWCRVAAATGVVFHNNNKIQFGYIPAGKNQIDTFGFTYSGSDPYCYIQTCSFQMGLA